MCEAQHQLFGVHIAVISYMELEWPGNRTFKWNVTSLGKRLVVVRAPYCHIF